MPWLLRPAGLAIGQLIDRSLIVTEDHRWELTANSAVPQDRPVEQRGLCRLAHACQLRVERREGNEPLAYTLRVNAAPQGEYVDSREGHIVEIRIDVYEKLLRYVFPKLDSSALLREQVSAILLHRLHVSKRRPRCHPCELTVRVYRPWVPVSQVPVFAVEHGAIHLT